MTKGFWATLPKPFFVLAPMADVTDAAFRRMIASRGMPDALWTEFVSADGLMRADEVGKEKLMKDLLFTEAERPIVAQLFTSDPAMMEQAAALVRDRGFDGLDINMGCPDKSIEKQGAGAAMIRDPQNAREVIRAAKRGVGEKIPVSVKTRLGYNKDTLDEWLPILLAEEPAAVTIHARTRKEMSKVPARWERIASAVAIRDRLGSETLILGNGDVIDMADARVKALESGCDGMMLGRAIFGNPWLFATPKREVSLQEKLETLVEHTEAFEEILPHKNFAIMKKHYKAYVTGFEGAKEFRTELMEAKDAGEVRTCVEAFLSTRKNHEAVDSGILS